MKKYTEWGTKQVNNLRYERPANQLELRKQVPQNMKWVRKPPDFTCWTYIWAGDNKHKYWHGKCVGCGKSHTVRSDKIKDKWCKCKN